MWHGRAGSNKNIRYHGKCLKIARGKVKEDDKYTCPICDWRLKIPRDAARPDLASLISLFNEIPNLPFQPEEEQILDDIIQGAMEFHDKIEPYLDPAREPEIDVDILRYYLRKIEGAEILLTHETNFFRQALHKRVPIAPEAPPLIEESKSTRKPRPTKLQKMMAQFQVDDPEDLPERVRLRTNSTRRRMLNAADAATASFRPSGPMGPSAHDSPSQSQEQNSPLLVRRTNPRWSSPPSHGAAAASDSHSHGRALSSTSSGDRRTGPSPMQLDGGGYGTHSKADGSSSGGPLPLEHSGEISRFQSPRDDAVLTGQGVTGRAEKEQPGADEDGADHMDVDKDEQEAASGAGTDRKSDSDKAENEARTMAANLPAGSGKTESEAGID